MNTFLKALWSDESGQDFAEYALLLVLIAVALVTITTDLKDAISDAFQSVIDNL